MTGVRPSTLRYVRADPRASGALTFLGIWWLLAAGGYLAFRHDFFPGDEQATFVAVLAVPTLLITVGCGILATRRVLLIRRLLGNGARVAGRIARMGGERGIRRLRGRLVPLRRPRVHARVLVPRTPRAAAYREGEEVELMVDHRSPKRALLSMGH